MAARDSREKAEWVDADEQQRAAASRQPPPPNRWGNNNVGENIVSPAPDHYQNAPQNQLFNNTKGRNQNDGTKVSVKAIRN